MLILDLQLSNMILDIHSQFRLFSGRPTAVVAIGGDIFLLRFQIGKTVSGYKSVHALPFDDFDAFVVVSRASDRGVDAPVDVELAAAWFRADAAVAP